MKRIVWTFGLIAGAFLSVMMLISLAFHDQIGFDKSLILGYTTMVLAFLMVFFGVRAYRDNVAGGKVSFGRAFKVGILISAIACACYVATWQLISSRLAPDYMDKWAAYSIDKARKSGASEAEIAAETKQMGDMKEKLKNPLFSIAMTLLEPLPVALVFTLVTAGVLSRKRRAGGAAAAAH
jgi:hypothetical protein